MRPPAADQLREHDTSIIARAADRGPGVAERLERCRHLGHPTTRSPSKPIRDGALLLTTLVYALPDGTPVQRIGLLPQVRFPFAPQGEPAGADEREAKLLHSAPPWRGPDIRDLSVANARTEESSWPSHGGNVGPCKDAEVCKALRLLGGPKRSPTAKH